MCRFFFLSLVVLLSRLALGQGTSTDASDIVKRSVIANQRDWDAAPSFDCFEQDHTKGGSKTYEDLMILGSPYERLISVNGRPLSSEEEVSEKRKLDSEIEVRRQESPQKKAQRIAKYEAERKHNHALMEQLTTAFDFKVVGEQRLNGYEVYVLRAVPRASYRPPDMASQALTGMQGTLWIDKASLQWVKVQARVTHPVSIEGFLAQVEPGTRFELEKRPVSADVWLPSHFSMTARAKVLFLFPHNGQEDETYFKYHKTPSLSALQSEGRR